MDIQEIESASNSLDSYLNAQSVKITNDEELERSFSDLDKAVGFFNGVKYREDLIVTNISIEIKVKKLKAEQIDPPPEFLMYLKERDRHYNIKEQTSKKR